jgi:hypothetical protein
VRVRTSDGKKMSDFQNLQGPIQIVQEVLEENIVTQDKYGVKPIKVENIPTYLQKLQDCHWNGKIFYSGKNKNRIYAEKFAKLLLQVLEWFNSQIAHANANIGITAVQVRSILKWISSVLDDTRYWNLDERICVQTLTRELEDQI